MTDDAARAVRGLFDGDEVQSVLRQAFFRPDDAGAMEPPKAPKRTPKARAKKPKPDHYEVICISMYREDLAGLDAKVADLKRRGHRKMTRSALIRFALDHVDLSKLPRAY